MQNSNESFDIEVTAQYLKDLSFENPNSPMSLIQKDAPKIGLDVNVNIQKFEENNYEVVLNVTATATNHSDETIFIVSVAYAGIFDLSTIPEEFHRNVLVIYCPTLLFPFVRAIVSDATRDGGFPPLMLKPIDFTKLYQQDNEQSIN
ncbi:MAG: protein-export chaperone SecB [Sphingobacteriia bacterium]|nr:protein-export chaperone SecB [Sphingobacteriia bacterium]